MMQAIPGAKSPLSWVGGKSQLAAKILPLAPDHTCYVEAFAGAAWVLFRKPPSEVEVINDLNSELVTLYRVIQNHLDEFVRYFRWLLVAREEFERFKATAPATLTDIQRAVRFYYLVKTGHSSRVPNPTFGYGTTGPPRLNLTRIEEDLSQAHLRLARVFVENLTWESVIDRYDRPHTWFYLDPPYWGVEDYYGKDLFAREDFARLAARLTTIKGKFTLSINDVKPIREVFRAFTIGEVSTSYSLGSAKRGQVVRELLITNYKPRAR
jgi:DNA adenine methylase